MNNGCTNVVQNGGYMKQLVGIKGNPYGITLRLDSEASFEEILVELDEKLKSSARFFRNANLALKVEKRSITEEEEETLIDHIERIAEVKVACIMDESKETTEYYQSMLEEAERIKQELLNMEELETTEVSQEQDKTWETIMQKENAQGQFYKGTLRSGQVVESGSSIIVLGDVNPGAKVVANGNIVVLGSLKGYAFAGAAGNDTAFVVALEMKPMQIRIGQYFAVDTGKRERKLVGGVKKGLKHPKIQSSSEPKIAFVSAESICIEPLSRDIMGDIHYQ